MPWQPAAAASRMTCTDEILGTHRVGLEDIEVVDRRPLSIDDCALYPVFGPDLIDLMRRLVPPAATTGWPWRPWCGRRSPQMRHEQCAQQL
ncbi:hypothetical protein ACWCQ0_39125 [Streptomyces massasporeus]|uniref:hypothetical protein n=1 Tax=Streptomyces massasporeus TaxID=67324 RepID=UPI0033F8B7A0